MPIDPFDRFVPEIHSDAFVHPGAHIIGEVQIHAGASIWPTAVLRGDHGIITIGAHTSIQDGCIAHGTENRASTHVGERCTVGHRAILHGCRVGNDCLVGMGSILLDNAQIGDGCFIAAGSLIPPGKVFPPGSFILGSPARRIRDVSDEERKWIDYSWKSYQALARRYPR